MKSYGLQFQEYPNTADILQNKKEIYKNYNPQKSREVGSRQNN